MGLFIFLIIMLAVAWGVSLQFGVEPNQPPDVPTIQQAGQPAPQPVPPAEVTSMANTTPVTEGRTPALGADERPTPPQDSPPRDLDH